MTAILSRERWVNGGTLAIRHTYMKVTFCCYPPTLWRAHVSVNHLTVGHPLMKYAGVRSLWVAVSWFNTLRPRQNGRHFADDMFIFLNKNLWIPIEISLKFVPKGSINNIRALVQIMAWRRTGNKPLSEPKMTQLNDAYMRHSASTSLNGSPNDRQDGMRYLKHIETETNWPPFTRRWIFLNENVWISIKISLKFVPRGPISNIPSLVQIMAWRRPGDKPMSELMTVSLLTHICVTRAQWVNKW